MKVVAKVRHVSLALAGSVLLALVLLSGAAANADAAPRTAWAITQTSMPTAFEPGEAAPSGGLAESAYPFYLVLASNVGGSASVGTVIVTDTLPAGLSPAAAHAPETVLGTGIAGTCNSVGQTVSCETETAVPAGAVFAIAVPVDVSPLAQGTVINKISVESGGGAATSRLLPTEIGSQPQAFGFLPGSQGMAGMLTTEAGEAATQAGSRPASLTLEAGFPTKKIAGLPARRNVFPVAGQVRSLGFSLPQGVVADPTATPVRCTEAQLVSDSELEGEGCPLQSQIGLITARWTNEQKFFLVGLYNMVPPPGTPAEFGFQLAGTVVHVRGGLTGDFRLSGGSSEILAKTFISNLQVTLWGDPSASSHDRLRKGSGRNEICEQGIVERAYFACPVPKTNTPLLTMPSACSGPLELSAVATAWEDPTPSEVSRALEGPDGVPAGVSGCDLLAFSPSIAVTSESQSTETPTGLEATLAQPQNESSNSLATATLKKVMVRLPDGFALNPPAADGLGACSPAQIGLGNAEPADCPAASKVGTVELTTPLLDFPLQGSVYVAEQSNNPFGTLLALYIAAEGEGIVVKLPGRVDLDPATGQLTALFDDNPELPFDHLRVRFKGGARAPLVTPPTCGDRAVSAELTSWASAQPVPANIPMPTDLKCGTRGFDPKLQAGTTNPVAGTYSPFILRITREDGEQNLASVSTTLPGGLLAKLAGIPLCSDVDAAAASCPIASKVGTTTVGTGAGVQPLYIPQPGKAPAAVFLSGRYRDAPYSLVIEVPAQAGPFDLGTIAVRVALAVDPFTAQVTATSDPLPQILQGIPVVYRDIRVNVDRESFILNPTACDPRRIEARLTSSSGASSTAESRFQVASCERLAFKPGVRLHLKGATKRTGHPALKAVVTYPRTGDFANIARAQVGLPPSEFLDQGNLDKVCKQAELRVGSCPTRSIYGRAKAWSPLLDQPLEGPVYLAVGFGYKLPALVAELNGQVRILLKGKVDTTKQKGLRNTFEAIPDAPVSRFVLEMKGGKKYGLLENSENICRKAQRASALFTAQNGKVDQIHPLISNSCPHQNRSKHK